MTAEILPQDEAIAVIGIGCWYPDAPTPARLWENVLAQRRAFRRLPPQRLALAAYHDEDRASPDKTYGTKAATIDGFEFDWVGRRIPRSTLETTDVAHWLALEVALRALEDAGYGRETLPRDRTGVIVGNTLTGEQSRSLSLRVRWPFVERALRAAAHDEGLTSSATDHLVSSAQSHFKSVFPPVDEDTLAGSLSNTIAGRICNFLDLHGGGYVVDGACASSLLAVTSAATALQDGDLDVALVGGVDISLDPFELVGFAKVGALSPTDMRVYDRAANGFVPGEGCGFVVLKRLADARADGDYVYASVRGWGVSSDGAGGIAAPSVDGQALAIRRAYKRAGYSPGSLRFVEGHGTGTPAGDPVELKAIAAAMRAYGESEPRRCGVTSFKSIVGHTKAAAGIGGFIKATIAANRRVIPPTAGCVNPNPTFEKDAQVLFPIREGWVDPSDAVVRAGVSAMGFGGINTHVTLESCDPPASRLRPSLDEEVLLASAQKTELFVLSAKSVDQLEARVEQLEVRADGMSVGELPDLAAELAAEIDPDHRVRAALVASDPETLQLHLEAVRSSLRDQAPKPGSAPRSVGRGGQAWLANEPQRPRVGLLFPGQGSQQIGMARRLVRRFDWARRFIEEADAWLVELGGEPISELVFRELDRAEDDDRVRSWRETLRRTEHAQPAICVASVLWLKYLARLGVFPAVVSGHSLGELSAFHAAGAFDERTLVELAWRRGQLMGRVDASGAMANLACSEARAEALIAEESGYCTIANLNAPAQTVVSGDRDAVARVVEAAKRQSIAAFPLEVSGAFHSAHFKQAALQLRRDDAVPEISNPLHTPAISAVDGAELRTGIMIRDYLSRQMCAKVDFVRVAKAMEERCDLLVEVGPGRVLSGLVKRRAGDERLLCFPVESRANNDEDLNVALAALFAHGQRLRLDALYDGRLRRPFVPASERKFIENPCERPFASEIAVPEETLVRAVSPVSTYAQASQPTTHAASATTDERPERESRIVLKSTVRGAVLAAVEQQTGFPVASLGLELRLVDDLHLDSIKTVELVSDVADQLGITQTFDAAELAEATLGELIERLEALDSAAPAAPAETTPRPHAAVDVEPSRVSVNHFTLQWSEEALPLAEGRAGLGEGRVLVLTSNPENRFAARVFEELSRRGVDALLRDCARALDELSALDHLLVLVPDDPSGDELERLERLAELLTTSSRLLPSNENARDRASCVAYIKTGAASDAREGYFDYGLSSFAATVHLERRRLRVRSLEVSDAALRPAEVAEAILRELEHEATFASVRYEEDGRRLVGRPLLQSLASYEPRASSLGAQDIVLATGGAKGITAECALALARETDATMVLVGSSPAPDSAPASPGGDEIRRTLARFAAEGLQCEYRRCNLADREDVERLVTGIRQDFGSIAAVLHGAGLNLPRRVEEATTAEALSEISPKLAGALHLFDALGTEPPRMFIALTSIIGVTGMPHNAWYALANECLDRALGRFGERFAATEVLSVAYSVWDSVGMGAKLGSIERLGKLGIEAIPVDQGASELVDLAMRNPGAREVIVTGRLGGLDTWKPIVPALPRAHRFLDQITTLELGRKLVCRTKLDLERDPYVRDHVYDGSHLFPTVFGLEAMAQAAAHVTGRAELPFPLRVEDVELPRPLVVHPERGLLIELRASVDLPDPSGEVRVRVEIRSKQTGFERAHFSACFVLEAVTPDPIAVAPLGDALPIRPETHLYGPVLFQGPRFQRIARLHELDSERCSFTAQHGLGSEDWLLGDPYFRDALLQSLQLCVVPDQCLPVRIAQWDIHTPGSAHLELQRACATIDAHEGETYVGTVSASTMDGVPVECLRGYHARVLRRRPEWPSAAELAASASEPASGVRSIAREEGARNQVNVPEPWDGGVFYRDVPGYGHEGQTAFFCRFPLSAQDSSSVSGSLSSTSYFRWAGKLREWGGMNTPGVYEGILEMLGSNSVMSATNECETRIFKTPERADLIEGRYWMEYVNKGDAGNIFEWWRIPFPTGKPEMIAWTRMRISAVKAVRHGVIASTDWPDFLYRFLKDMGDDAPEPTLGPQLGLELGATLFSKPLGPQPGPLLAEQSFATAQEDSNVVGNIYFANYSVWQARVTDRFLHSLGPHLFEDRGARGEAYRAETKIYQLRDAMPFDKVSVVMRLDELYERGARLSYDFFRIEPEGATKIAAGTHLLAWAVVERGALPRLLEWPRELRDGVLACADQTVHTYQKLA